MRTSIALAIVLLMLPLASSTEAEPRDALAVSLFDIEESAVVVTWSAAPGAIAYDIYKGPTQKDLTLVGESTTTVWLDESAHTGTTWYVVVTKHAQGAPELGLGAYRGACVNQRGTTGVSVTAAHCVPARPL